MYLLHEKKPPVWLRLKLPSAGEVDLRIRALPAAQPASAALSRALLKALDSNRDGRLGESEARKASALLDRLDSDEDGCLTPMELVPDLPTTTGGGPRQRFAVPVAFALKLDGPRSSCTVGGIELDVACTKAPPDDPLAGAVQKGKLPVWTLWVVPGQRGWFEWLDRDGDGQLSLTELRGAWDRLADESAKKRGWLALAEPKGTAYTLTAMPGSVGRHGVCLIRPETTATRGPDWFRAMDRNGDGFVSRAEFLGKAEAFDRLDRDGDGLISPDEAEAATKPENASREKKR